MRALSTLLLGAVLLPALAAQRQPGALFSKVVDTLAASFHDAVFRQQQLPALAARYRAAAVASASLDEERAVVHALLGEVPASHLALYSAATYRSLDDDLVGRTAPTFGCQLLELGGRFHVDAVLDGGPADRAGLRAGEPVLAIDGVPPGRSRRLDWRSDDAYLPDPAVHLLRAKAGDTVALRIGAAGQARTVKVTAAEWSALQASRQSRRVLVQDGHRIGYLHLWMVFHGSAAPLVQQALEAFADVDAVVLDLRGRGGSALEVMAILDVLAKWRRAQATPLRVLVDARTRSAKEVLAYEIHRRGLGVLVGETTAGAVLPATFADLGGGNVLMYPKSRLGRFSDALEGKGVAPDLLVPAPLPPVPGQDPILAAACLQL